MEFDPFLLARLQFAANISFHILFPTITIGLCWVLFYFRLRYTFSGDKAWEYAYFFWVKIFALSFALGVVSGITMSFQFGTNWPGFMEKAGNIAGPLLGYEVLTAFFLEASFLGIMLFGKNRVSNRLHLTSCALVAVGTSFSAFWILSLNSWMQTPTGFRLEDGVFYVDSWWTAIFNPSFPYRLAHMFNASLLTAAFLIMGVSAWRAMRRVDGPATWKVMRTGAVMAAVLAPLQVWIGDLHGLNTLEHQPAKIAAMEGVWETESNVPLTLFGFPDEEQRTTHMAIKVPGLGSLILTHDWNGELKGLNDFEGDHPPVAPVFWSFRVMVGVGVLMVLVGWWAAWRLFRRRDENRDAQVWLLRALSVMTFSGWVAVLAGWYVTEIGRQPWMVSGLMRTSEVVADHSSATVMGTLFGYVLLYVFLLVSYIAALRYMATKPARSLSLTPQQRAMKAERADDEQAEGEA
ncbi:MAG: cytochrome D ubiquinol oxidase subunit I [Alcanivorax borkumensis]|uniref:Cytochrome bd-1 oxidase, subunit I n=2 Tax=Pseudomonadati TaxID=3379134 RepID=Q0VLS8_ALCBS|nr:MULTISPECIES: cytochrome ubiquinol oxidase subunit I [Alcanivorax]OJH07352.1 MAG: cytochrome D ubiquinol oxidase subunit I [Alcanivorax borkumensis]EUC68734.1 cytochrome D ubiquinol oxidase subunit I [Alcanivorax sp. 97CO-5]PKG00798.1 cytochrome ubiquinol oxidase subunit I [Alcanivorax sp. 97CO-6]CAL17870.1 cytochrome bd-1 oxidase, subunit I [Alcanivorax borkumensis SK2]BAP15333.1 cytochrome bd-1 oxidase subunit I [Alcanivorax sp. NBRC 101098]